MKWWTNFYEKYKEYIRVDLVMYIVMFLGVFIFLGIMMLAD